VLALPSQRAVRTRHPEQQGNTFHGRRGSQDHTRLIGDLLYDDIAASVLCVQSY
jgi:hypothetical protein